MKLYPTVLFLCLSPAVVVGQRARAVRPERAFYAPRHLHELTTSSSDGMVRATGDLDDDGDLDLLTLYRGPLGISGVQTWRNDGLAEFQPAYTLDFPWDDLLADYRFADYVFLADVTGDGRLDLAYDRRSPNPFQAGTGVLVHPGLGDGSFGERMLIPCTPRMGQFVVGDCDGDGDPDLLVQGLNWPESTSQLTWWSFQGSGFVSGPSLAVSGGQLVAVDVDANGIADAAMAGVAPDYDAIQVFPTVNGAPTPGQVIPRPSGIPVLDFRLQTGDLEGDGDEDLLTAHWSSSVQPSVFHLRPIRNDGGTFHSLPVQSFPQPSILDGGESLSLYGTLADWDADGDLDFVSQKFSWMENTGMTFTLAARQESGASPSRPLHVVDLNGDGHLDALTNATCHFGNSRFPARSSTTPEVFGPLFSPLWRQLEDWEGDGDLDLVDSAYLYLNNGDGSFVGRATPLPSVPGNQGTVSQRAWGDFDGDGFRDVVAALIEDPIEFDRMVLFTGREDGSYQLSPTVPSTLEIDAGLAGDIDGDGDLDILSLGGFWQNSGTGDFGGLKFATYAGRPLLARDVDGDLDLDLLVGRSTRLELRRNFGDGSGSSVAEDLGPYVAGILPTLLDLDQDGDLDLAVARPSSDVVSVHEQLPGGGFAAPFELAAHQVASPPGQIDVDGDGRLDLVAGMGDSQYGRLGVWFREPGLGFAERREWMTVRCLPRAFGDVDRDGDVEPIGDRPFENFRFDGAGDGLAVQYGLEGATSGTGGRHPVLGSGGPVRPGRDIQLVIGRGLGGASGVLLRGDAPADVLGGGFRNLVAAPQVVRSFVLGGAAGAAGAGSVVLRAPVGFALVGRTFFYQAVLVDPGASAGLSATNGLEIQYGDRP